MKSIFLVKPGIIELRDVPIPKPVNGELVIKVETALTCGTDLKAFRRGHPKMPMPTQFGHEFSGTIADAGTSPNGYREGDAIMGVHTAPCGQCYYCQRQRENLCPDTMANMVMGAYAEYIKIPRRVAELNMFAKPETMTYEEAAFIEPLACVVHGMQPLNITEHDTVLIIGAGAIGLIHIQLARLKGAGKILVLAKHEERQNLARQFGAEVIDAAASNAAEAVQDATNGYGANLVFECTGRQQVWHDSLSMVATGGTIILFGGCPPGTSIPVDTGWLHYDEISLMGSFHFTPRDVREAYGLLADRKIDVASLITEQYPLNELQKAFDLLAQGRGIKYAIQP